MKSFVRKISGFFLKQKTGSDNSINAFQNISKEDILSFSSKYTTPEIKPDNIALDDVLKKIDNERNINIHKERKFKINYINSAAASILVIIGLALIFNNIQTTKVFTSAGQQVTIYLPDSSEVIINSASRISYKPKEWKSARIVKLEGEAFFRVKKGKRFEVHTKKCITAVLGTSFNVFARDNNFKVSCFTGKVRVEIKNNKSSAQLLTAGYETKMTDSNTLEAPYELNIQNVSLWQKGEFYFNNEPLENVFAEMERQFNVHIKTENISNRTFTGYFFRDNLQQALKLVCEPMQLTYEINGKTIVVKYKLIN